MSIQESIKIVPQGEIAVVEFDLVGEKVNKFSTPVMMRFKEVLEELNNKYEICIYTGYTVEEIK